MAHVITALCVRCGSCMESCPTECIVPGKPEAEWPHYYIDSVECIDCGACIAECEKEAIFMDDEVPTDYEAYGGEPLSMPEGTEGFDEEYEGEDVFGDTYVVKGVRYLKEGEVIDLSGAAERNDAFYESGPGYDALD